MQADPASRAEPVALEAGLKLRGSIDLVERGLGGRLRVTDHKTGKVDAPKDVIIGGGKTSAAGALRARGRADARRAGRGGAALLLHARGGYEERVVRSMTRRAPRPANSPPLSPARSRTASCPPRPADGGCRWCDYRPRLRPVRGDARRA